MATLTLKVKKLSSEMVIKFGQMKEKYKAIDKELKTAIPKIKELMLDKDMEDVTKTKSRDEEGNVTTTYTYGPSQSPYRLELLVFEKTDVSWKDEYLELFKKIHGGMWEEKWDEKIKNLPTKDEQRLDCKVNPDYRPPKSAA